MDPSASLITLFSTMLHILQQKMTELDKRKCCLQEIQQTEEKYTSTLESIHQVCISDGSSLAVQAWWDELLCHAEQLYWVELDVMEDTAVLLIFLSLSLPPLCHINCNSLHGMTSSIPSLSGNNSQQFVGRTGIFTSRYLIMQWVVFWMMEDSGITESQDSMV